MTATRSYKTVLAQPGSGAFAKSEKRWVLRVGDQPTVRLTDWKCESVYGSVESAVVVDGEGRPAFDRPLYREAFNVNVVCYGIDADGVAKFAVISQPRPHADDPEQIGDAHDPVVFGQIVMGFLDKIIGGDLIARYESAKDGVIREIREESGAHIVLDMSQPAYPWHNPNPTFVATWSDLYFVKVDLAAIEQVKSTRSEPIFKAEFITAAELRRRVKEGKGPASEVYRMCTANSAWFIFFCTYPELFV